MVMILFNYATTANYSWIFIEGLYLHMLLFVAVFSENTGVRWYIVSGWSKSIHVHLYLPIRHPHRLLLLMMMMMTMN